MILKESKSDKGARSKTRSESHTLISQSTPGKVKEEPKTQDHLYKMIGWVSHNPVNAVLLLLETGGGSVTLSKGEWFWFLMILLVALVHLKLIKVKDVDLPELIRALYPWKTGKESKLADVKPEKPKPNV